MRREPSEPWPKPLPPSHDKRLGNLSRKGRGQTERPRIYVGCLPCAQKHWAATLEAANRWIETHWRRCRGPLSRRGSEATETAQQP